MLEFIMDSIYDCIDWFDDIDIGNILGMDFNGINLWALMIAMFFIGSVFTIIWGGGDDD